MSMAEAFENVNGLVVFPGGFPEPDGSDLAYEEDLKRCRAMRHTLYWFRVDGVEVGVCSRCHAKFREVIE